MARNRTTKALVQTLNVGLRAIMEFAIVAGLAVWGYHFSGLALAIAAPVAGFGLWGAVDFRHAGAIAEPLRLMEELIISGLAAAAWYAAGQHILGAALAILSIAHHALVYLLGGTLLKQ